MPEQHTPPIQTVAEHMGMVATQVPPLPPTITILRPTPLVTIEDNLDDSSQPLG